MAPGCGRRGLPGRVRRLAGAAAGRRRARGARSGCGRTWLGLPWSDVEQVEHLPRRGLLRDGRLVLVPRGRRAADRPGSTPRGRRQLWLVARGCTAPRSPVPLGAGHPGDRGGGRARPRRWRALAAGRVRSHDDRRAAGATRVRRSPPASAPWPRGSAPRPPTSGPDAGVPAGPPAHGERRRPRPTGSSGTVGASELVLGALGPGQLAGPGHGRPCPSWTTCAARSSPSCWSPTGSRTPEPVADPVIGPVLAAARRRLSLGVDGLAERTRIRPHVIEAIEVDDFAPCGGDFYARGHLRTLARVLGRRRGPAAGVLRRALRPRPDQPAPGLRGRARHRSHGLPARDPRRPQLVGARGGRSWRSCSPGPSRACVMDGPVDAAGHAPPRRLRRGQPRLPGDLG